MSQEVRDRKAGLRDGVPWEAFDMPRTSGRGDCAPEDIGWR